MEIKGFKPINYDELISRLNLYHAEYMDDGGSEFKLADLLEVKTIQTVRNCFSPKKQIVADALLTKLMKGIGLSGFVIWEDGERKYYVKPHFMKNGKVLK